MNVSINITMIYYIEILLFCGIWSYVSCTSTGNSSVIQNPFPLSTLLNQNSTILTGITQQNNSVAIVFQIENSSYLNDTRLSWPFLSIQQESSLLLIPRKKQDVIQILLDIQDTSWLNTSYLNQGLLSVKQQPYFNLSIDKKQDTLMIVLDIEDAVWVNSSYLASALKQPSLGTVKQETYWNMSVEKKIANSVNVLFQIENISWMNVSKIIFNEKIVFVREESNYTIVVETLPSLQVFFYIAGIDWFNASRIQFPPNVIFVRQYDNTTIEVNRASSLTLSFQIQNISQLQFTILDFVRSIAGNITKEQNEYDVQVQSACSPGEYFNVSSQTCFRCSPVPLGNYLVSQCSLTNDTQYTPCRPCTLQEFEHCPCNSPSETCPSRNRICYSYPTWNVTSGWLFISQLNQSTLWNYIQNVMFFLQKETQCQSVGISSLKTTQIDQISYQYNLSLSIVNLWKIPLQRNSIDNQYIIPDFTPLIEKSSYKADLIPRIARRSLLELPNFNCSSDYYLHYYDGLGYQCIPCVFDPVPGYVNTSNPGYIVNLWVYANNPCGVNQARICLGGSDLPICVTRQGAWNVTNTTSTVIQTTSCPIGSYLFIQSNIVICIPIPCAPGSTGQPGDCTLCDAGTYKSIIGPSSCIPCASGTYSTISGQTTVDLCLQCKDNSISPIGSNNPNDCSCIPGSYIFSDQCSLCVGGTYSSGINKAICHTCESGTFSLQGSTTCSICKRGYYSNLPKSTSCTSCPSHSFANGSGLTSCSTCNDGTGFTLQTYTCDDCMPGWYSGTGICLACDYGTFSTGQNMNSSDTCVTCKPGMYAYTKGSSTCTLCIPGTYGLSCAKCFPGTYQTSYGGLDCTSCSKGTYSSGWGMSKDSDCQNCNGGTYWINSSACLHCPKNTISPPASIQLTDCSAAPGFYAFPGQEGILCPVNYYCPQGTTNPAVCDENTISLPGSSACFTPSTNVILFDWIVGICWLITFSLIVGCYLRHRIMLVALWRHQGPLMNVRREIRIKIFG